MTTQAVWNLPVKADCMSQEQLAEAFAAFAAAAQTLEQSYFGLGREISRLRSELEQERELRRRREALAEVAAVLAHEIRNPLGIMELFTGLLASSDLRQQEEQWVMQIQSGLRLASATVNNILEFHAAGRLAMRPVEINELLQSVQALLAPLARRAGMRWEGNLFSEELWISGDRERLQQVFVNLALNAFRFASAGGILRVGSEASEDGSVSVWFADAGPGIAPEILQRLYEPGISSRAGGTGLGLALAKRIVELHNGSIEVSSSGGEGSRFDLRFQRLNPLHQAAAAPVVEMARSAGACA